MGDRFLADMPGWHVWPELKTGVDFMHVGENYREHVTDCRPEDVFGGVRYDLGLLSPSGTISGLIEIKRHWTQKHLEKKGDLPKLARALFYLGKPPHVQNGVKRGVLLESVFFGSFIWHDPKASDENALPLEVRYRDIESKVRAWWQEATTGGGAPIQREFETRYNGPCPQPKIRYERKAGKGSKEQWVAGAVCVCLSLNEDP